MKTQKYNFSQGFSIHKRKVPGEVFFAMGDTHIFEESLFDLYLNEEFIETYEKFEDAKNFGINLVNDTHYE